MIKKFSQFINEEFFYAGRDLVYETSNGNKLICEIENGMFCVESKSWWVDGNTDDMEPAVVELFHDIEKSWDDFKSNSRFFRTNKNLEDKVLISGVIMKGLSIRSNTRKLHKLTQEIEKIMPVEISRTSEDYIVTFDKPLEFNFEGMEGI